MAQLITTLGTKNADELGMILPHEHVFVDLRTWNEPGYGQADPTDVVRLMAPEIEKIKALGVTALVECSTGGVGVRADIDKAVSDATSFPIVVPTGFYREPWIPPWVHNASEDRLYEFMMGELQGTIDDSGVQAGWIKLSAGDDGITECERKVLRAAIRAAKETNAVIGSHTIKGSVVKDQLSVFDELDHPANRFIWIHTQAEPDFDLHLKVAMRGAWLEYDGIGADAQPDEAYITNIKWLLDAGYGNQLMLSHDRGWYDPAQPNGGTPKPYTYISKTFLPKLKSTDVDAAAIRQLTHTNPFQAFAR